jgi:hypothetical protein
MTQSQSAATTRSGRKTRWFFALVVLLLTLLSIELISYASYFIVSGHSFSFSEVKAARRSVIENDPSEDGFEVAGLKIPWNVPIHPYYGFGKPEGFNFLENPDDEIQNDPNGIIVAVTGGSVAHGLYKEKREALKAYLQQIPKFEGRNVHIVLLGYFAWKQPQQVTALSYYLAMGGKVDVLINLDGHNEIVDANTNYRREVFPAYPWLWYNLASNTVSAKELRLIGEIRYRKNLRHSVAQVADKVAHGVSGNVIWYLLDRLIGSGIEQRSVRLSELQFEEKSSHPFRQFGPNRSFDSQRDRLSFSTHIWLSSSIQLDRMMKANGGEYFHFLQPNQYVPRSKTFSREERRTAYDPRRVGAIRVGYPYLQNASSVLQNAQVQFFDLTGIFKDVKETVYRDRCCHVNGLGNELLARGIGTGIANYYADQSKVPTAPEG